MTCRRSWWRVGVEARRAALRLAASALVLLACCGRSGCEASPRAPARVPQANAYRRIDTHAHIMPASSADALELYRRAGVDVAINVTGRYPGSGQDEVVAASRASRGRLYFMCNIMWDLPVDHPDFVRLAISAIERCNEQGGLAWKIPKVLGLGAVYSDGSLVPVDARELDPIFERCGELGLPVLIHSGDPQAFWQPLTPENERYEELRAHPAWSFAGPGFPSWEEVFAQYERRVARHPRVTFIGAHFGNDPEDPRRVAQMLDRYPNLMIDTAARIPEIGRHDPREMHDFFVRYQDRILFATDLGYGRDMLGRVRIALGSGGDEPPTEAEIERFWASTWRYFETRDRDFPNPTPIQGRWPISGVGLPREVLEKIYHANAERLFHFSLPAR